MSTIENLKGELWKNYIDNYYFSNRGRVKRIGKSKEWLINPYIKASKKGHKKLIVKIKGKEVTVSNAVYRLFVGNIPNNYRVIHRNNVFTDNDFINLQLVSLYELGKITGCRNSKRRLIYDADHDCYYKSTREAAKKLFISRQTVSDYCNKKVKKPMYDLMWS